MARYVSAAPTVDYTPSSAVTAGDVVLLNDLVTVSPRDIAANALGAVAYQGAWELPKGSDTINQGDQVYWTGTAITTTSSGNTPAGKAYAAAASGASLVVVLLNV